MSIWPIITGLTGFPPPVSRRRRSTSKNFELPDLNAGRRVWRDPERKENCFQCRRKAAVIFVYCPPTSKLRSEERGYCETCWSS